jgi:hypothetical protein
MPRRAVDDLLAAISEEAAAQHGLFTRMQAVALGATEGSIRWGVAARRWNRVDHNVFALHGAPATWQQRALAACLSRGPGVAITHRAAAALGQLPGFVRSTIELTVDRRKNWRSATGIKVYRASSPIPLVDITTVEGIPVTRPARTLLDLATIELEPIVEHCLDDCLRRGLVSLPFLQDWLVDPTRERHRGAPKLIRLVEARTGIGSTESPLETDALVLIRDAGLPLPVLQYPVWDGRHFVGRVDMAYPHVRVAIELDGFRYHDTRATFDRERTRGNDLQRLSWNVIRITSKHLRDDPQSVIGWIRAALRQRGALGTRD